jgi:hypothetical protein
MLIQRSDAQTPSKRKRTEWLTFNLAARPAQQIIEFELHLAAQRKRVDSRLIWGTAHILQGWCSSDSFWYFQPWLVGLGRDAFDRVAADADALADIPQIRHLAARPKSSWSDDEWPEWEALNYVALHAHKRNTGEADGLDSACEAQGFPRICDPHPEDEAWDYDDVDQRRARFPRLTELLGVNPPRLARRTRTTPRRVRESMRTRPAQATIRGPRHVEVAVAPSIGQVPRSGGEGQRGDRSSPTQTETRSLS